MGGFLTRWICGRIAGGAAVLVVIPAPLVFLASDLGREMGIVGRASNCGRRLYLSADRSPAGEMREAPGGNEGRFQVRLVRWESSSGLFAPTRRRVVQRLDVEYTDCAEYSTDPQCLLSPPFAPMMPAEVELRRGVLEVVARREERGGKSWDVAPDLAKAREVQAERCVPAGYAYNAAVVLALGRLWYGYSIRNRRGGMGQGR